MGKRRVEHATTDSETPPAPTEQFSSLVSRYSFSISAGDELETKPSSTPVTPPETPQRKKTKVSRVSPGNSRNPGYAPPSAYSHLPTPDLDVLAHGLVLLFIGLNPGVATALAQHAFAGPTNKFWPLLYSSGITSLRHTFEIDKSLPKLYNVGITNLIPRPTRCASELSKSEMLASVDVVEEKVRMYKPKAVCVVGKGIWETFYERKHAGKKVGKDFKFGWQAERIGIGNDWSGAQCFVTPSTSGRVATYSREFQEVLWKELGYWVRLQRGDIEQEGVKLESEDDMAVSEFSHRTNIKKEVLDT